MSALVSLRKRALMSWMLFVLALGAVDGPRTANATDFNIDYPGTVAQCAPIYGGAALKLTGIGVPGSPAYPYYIDRCELFYSAAAADCSGNTWVTWACNTNCATNTCAGPLFTGFVHDTMVHLGVTVDDAGATMSQGYVYNNQPTWEETKNVTDAAGAYPCSAANTCILALNRASRGGAAIGPGDYSCLGISPFGVHVHTDGKTLVVLSGASDPPCPCKESMFLGGVRFEYYGVRQELATLNRFSGREPFEVDSVAGGPVACGDSIVVTNTGVPSAARYVVITGTMDSVATVDSPRGTRFWVQEVIVHEGEHLITASAGSHGTIDPRGSVVVADGGSQSFTIIPDASYRVADVQVDGISVGPVTSYSIANVTAPHSIMASFVPINASLDCSHVKAMPGRLWPPDHRLVPVSIGGVSDQNGDPVAVRVTGVTQDEATGQGEHCPSAVVDASGTCQLRAERAGKGNGRVYRISFTASDGHGGSCDGSATVTVPHDMGHPSAIDDGQGVNAMGPCSAEEHEPGQQKGDQPRRLEFLATSLDGRSATVEFSVPASGPVRLAVYDSAGRRVAVIQEGHLDEGTHRAVWNAGWLARGVYFYRLQAGSAVVGKTLLILR
jgi:hypothetical protein